MSLKILSHLFTGPYDFDTTKVRANQDPVIFAIISRGGKPWNPEFSLMDIGKSGEKGVVFNDHPQRNEWLSLCKGDSEACIYLLSVKKDRKEDTDPRDKIIQEIRESLKPPGGAIPIHGMM